MDLSEELRACIARGRCAAEPDAPSERRAVRIRSIEKVHPQLQTGLQGVTDGWFGVVSSAQKVLLWSTGPAAPRSAPEPHLSDLSDIEALLGDRRRDQHVHHARAEVTQHLPRQPSKSGKKQVRT